MKEVKLLQDQMEKLNKKEFDLDAWKQYTVVLLARIFGEHDPKIRQIEKIEYDFSSWSLRDTSGKSAYMESCKKLGREVLQASIDELKAFGLPDKQEKPEKAIPVESLIHALEEELKISQYRELVRLIISETDREEKIKKLKDMIDDFDKSFPDNVLLNFLADEQVRKALES